jgi:hypothetical protein
MSRSRFLLTWLAMAAAMTANGILRDLVLVRLMPVDAAVLASVALGAAIILSITHAGFRPLRGQRTPTLLRSSAALLAMTVAFEFAVGRWVDRESWSELAANYAFWRGSLWPFLLLLLALTPFLWGRWIGGSREVAGA